MNLGLSEVCENKPDEKSIPQFWASFRSIILSPSHIHMSPNCGVLSAQWGFITHSDAPRLPAANSQSLMLDMQFGTVVSGCVCERKPGNKKRISIHACQLAWSKPSRVSACVCAGRKPRCAVLQKQQSKITMSWDTLMSLAKCSFIV